MIRQKSKRYYKELAKIQGNGIVVDGSKGSEKGIEMKYENFNIEPGQSTWHDMPDDYKKAYFARQKEIEKELEKKAADAKERELREKIVEKRIKDRIANMEKKLFQKEITNAETKIFKPHKPKKKHSPLEEKDLGQSHSNFIDAKFFEKKRELVRQTLTIKEKRPKILFISDVCGWAWWNKSKYLQMYLEDDFDIDTICVLGDRAQGVNRGKYALYITYGYSYVHLLQGVNRNKRVTGITAHRDLKQLKPYMVLAKNLHANSKLLMSDFEKMGLPKDIKTYYVPNGVDETIFKPQNPIGDRKRLIAGHIGKQCPAKGQKEFIIPAMEKADVESFTNMNDYRNRKPFCEMGSHYQNMDVFMVASVEDGTPNPALEAAACGRPIISNPIGNMPEFIKDGYNGFLVPRKIEAYVEKLNILNNDRALLKKMGENARKTIEKEWTWKHQAENWRKMLWDILERK